MYHPSRGGVRGGSDQFTWDSVKEDKHRENYLGHSLMAPIGRWQKGKDLSWYSKERKGGDDETVQEKFKQIAAIKNAEEDAMLVALGFKSAEKEMKHIAKEEITDILRRNVEQDSGNSERIHGVGIGSGRASMLVTGSKQNEGMMFESSSKSCKNSTDVSYEDKSAFVKRKKSRACRKLKREKKDKHKKKRKHKRQLSDSEDNYTDMRRHKKKKKASHH